MNKSGLIALVVASALLSILTAVISLNVLVKTVRESDVTATEETQPITAETGENILITRLGTSSIKKLKLAKGTIYFTDGWAIYVID